jgi:hypothetical protein
LTEEFDSSIFKRFGEWDDAVTVLAYEAEFLAEEVGKWRGDVLGDLVNWGIQVAA